MKVTALRAQFKEFRADGWPLCPQCEEDELYSYLMLSWTKDEPPTIDECIATGMQCYCCSWKSRIAALPKRVFTDCFRCAQPFDLVDGEPQYIYCPPCREAIRAEAISAEVGRMEWPDVLEL